MIDVCSSGYLEWIFVFQKRSTTWKVFKYRVFSGPYFPAIGLNTGKYRPENTPYLDSFHVVVCFANYFTLITFITVITFLPDQIQFLKVYKNYYWMEIINQYQTIVLFLYPLKTSDNLCFLMFSRGIERENWHEMS